MNIFLNLLLFSAKLMTLKCQMSASNYISTKQNMVYLGGNTLEELQDADQMFCALSCSRTKDCQGVNFEIKARVCHLMSFVGPPKLKKASGFLFMEMLERKKDRTTVPKNCAELHKAGYVTTGVYTVNPDGLGVFEVYCDQATTGGGWTVFQRRLDGTVNFFRDWQDYKRGFGNLTGEFWLGLDKLHRLTKQNNSLRVELEDSLQNTSHAVYDLFSVSNEAENYKISVGGYSGTAGDSLKAHDGFPFSTKDRDNDSNSTIHCAQKCKGAWWYRNCMQSNLNGLYLLGDNQTRDEGMNWRLWKGRHYSAKRAQMKLRPVGFIN